MLAGWSASLIPGARLPELWSADESFYPRPALDGAPFDERADLVMAARCVAFSLTGKPDAVGDLPEPLAALLASWIAGTAAATDAWALRGAVDAAARKAYGAPKYVELKTPAWS